MKYIEDIIKKASISSDTKYVQFTREIVSYIIKNSSLESSDIKQTNAIYLSSIIQTEEIEIDNKILLKLLVLHLVDKKNGRFYIKSNDLYSEELVKAYIAVICVLIKRLN